MGDVRHMISLGVDPELIASGAIGSEVAGPGGVAPARCVHDQYGSARVTRFGEAKRSHKSSRAYPRGNVQSALNSDANDNAILLITPVYSGGVPGGDSGIDDRFLITINRAGRGPFGDSVGVDASGPAAGGEIVMVVTAKQSQIVQVRFAAIDPGHEVMSFAPFRGSIAARKGASSIPGVQGEGLAAGWRSAGSGPNPARRRSAVRTVGMMSAWLAIRSTWSVRIRVPSLLVPYPVPGEQIIDVDGDDHCGRGATRLGHGVGAEESVADVFEGVVHPLPVVPLIRGFDQPSVRPGDRVDARFGQGSEQGLEFAAERTGEPQGAGPGSVPALMELDMAAVLVELIFGQGAVGVDPVDHLGGEDAQVFDGIGVGELRPAAVPLLRWRRGRSRAGRPGPGPVR